MSSNQRPISVTCVALLFIAVGAVTLILLALAAGVFMLRRKNWARWLALAWMAFHIALSALPPYRGLVVHILIFVGIAYLLLRPDAAEYFRGAGEGTR
jgi:hypothetical protein